MGAVPQNVCFIWCNNPEAMYTGVQLFGFKLSTPKCKIKSTLILMDYYKRANQIHIQMKQSVWWVQLLIWCMDCYIL